MPIADQFEFLDRKYPSSKFIYTVRHHDEWLRSCKRHWSKWHDNGRDMRPEVIELLRRLYGTVDFDADLFAEAYDRHEAKVLSYFRDRPDDLLTIDICSKGEGWEPLCSFLGQTVPDGAFPHENKRKSPFERYLESSQTIKQMHRAWRKTTKKTRKGIRFITFRR
jgi:Sulfotransferase domain